MGLDIQMVPMRPSGKDFDYSVYIKKQSSEEKNIRIS